VFNDVAFLPQASDERVGDRRIVFNDRESR